MSTAAGPDALLRCGWCLSAPDYVEYHDTEWGVPVRGDRALFERITLEAFQSGLAWITILRKREGFRRAFAEFDIERIADFDEPDRQRLLADAGIVRNRAKIDATITNARALRDWQAAQGEAVLDELFWSFQPTGHARPTSSDDILAKSPESAALSKALKARGFVFVGPTTMHAAMQACGLINDHYADCEVSAACD